MEGDMLDSLLDDHPVGQSDWQDIIGPGDIVSFMFPVRHADEGGPALPARLCLVFDRETIAGQAYVRVAYGTHRDVLAHTGADIRLQTEEAVAAAGGGRPVRFACGHHVLVPLTHTGFDCDPDTGSPVLGRSTGGALDRLDRLRARYHAYRDMAAARRDERQQHERADRARAAAKAHARRGVA
jgi:hypothetical protein